ncbi:MAG: chorismate-binding protein [Treponemataceae bacterium]|nr:chorismate-binding protein [Treponemataceae bacterium]
MIVETLPGERFTPFSLAKKCEAKAVLESASFSQGKDRYSILMLDEAFRVVQDDGGVAFVISGERRPVYLMKGGDILDVLAEIAAENPPEEAAGCDFPLPSAGIGYLSYEFCARCDTIRLQAQDDELHIPESAFIVGHTFIVFDHFSEKIHICAQNYKEHQIDLAAAVAKIKRRLSDLDFSYLASPEEGFESSVITDERKSRDEYIEKVEALKKRIVAGDIIQAVPSRRLQIRSEIPALEVYRRLRSVNPSPYLFYLDFGSFQFTGASPESIVRVRDGEAVIHPIAGTRRRGKNSAEDEKLKAELLADAKERAEHFMLVDLARNDLGRVCKSGSVDVPRFMTTELYSHVIHLVSEVRGTLGGNVPAVNVLRAAFPAGTVSGAPKISAIEILSSLERTKRGFYAGAVGYITNRNALDFCIAIRCAVKQGDVWTLQAGGGIVHASDAAREYEETCEKLAAMRAVIEAAAK